jgi:hypothetical protein
MALRTTMDPRTVKSFLPIYPNKLPTVLTDQNEPNGVFGFRRLPNKPLPLACKAGTLSHPKEFRCHGSVIQAVMNRDKS